MKIPRRYTTRAFWNTHDAYQPQTYPAARVLANQMLSLVTSETGLPGGARVLEVGAGNGAFSGAIESYFELAALDLSAGLLRANPAKVRVEGDIYQLPFLAGTFDLVFATAVLHHLNDVSGALREMRRVSRGFVGALEPNRNNPLLAAYGVLRAEERGLLPFTAGWLADRARAADLRVVSCFPFGWISPNKTPTRMLPFFERLPLRHPLGTNLMLIARTEGQ